MYFICHGSGYFLTSEKFFLKFPVAAVAHYSAVLRFAVALGFMYIFTRQN